MTTARTLQDFQAQPEALRRAIEHLEGPGRHALAAAARTLGAAERVVVSGMGASYAAAVPLAAALWRAGRPALLMEAGELLHGALPACAGALVVLVSRSGESVEVVRLLDALAGRAAVVGVANVPGSPLLDRADLPVFLGAPNDAMVALQSYVATVGALLALAGMAGLGGPRAPSDLAPAIPALAQAVARAMDDPWEPPATAYVLGRGASWGSALEGQLLFHETARAPAVAMTGHGFRHGPFEAIGPGFQAWLFAPDGPLRPLDEALARDIRRAGGQCHVIGPGGEGGRAVALPPPLNPIVEVVPVQAAALRLAMHRGVEAGEFRWTAQVTRREDGTAREEP